MSGVELPGRPVVDGPLEGPRRREGGCHCGAVRFALRTDPDVEVLDCNCSICSKSGYLHLIVAAEDFQVTRGGEELVEYRFGTGIARHLFCRRCGIKSFYVPRSHPEGVSVNARCIDPGGIRSMLIRAYDGRHWEAARAGLAARTPG